MANTVSNGNGKQYVTVQATHYPNGEIVPVTIFFPGGRVFHIVRSSMIKDPDGSISMKLVFRIFIRKHETKLYLENGRWYVLRK